MQCNADADEAEADTDKTDADEAKADKANHFDKAVLVLWDSWFISICICNYIATNANACQMSMHPIPLKYVVKWAGQSIVMHWFIKPPDNQTA